MVRRVLVVLAIISGSAIVTFSGFRDCGWLETAFGSGSCAGSVTLDNIASVRSTVAVNSDGDVVVLGNRYTATNREGDFDVRAQIAIIDWQAGKEVRRIEPDFSGRPDQLILSATNEGMAITCRSFYACDLADLPSGQDAFGATQLALLDEDGSINWVGAVMREEAPPSVEGRAFDLAFSADGRSLVAGPVVFSVADGARGSGSAQVSITSHATLLASYDFELAGQRRSLGLPAGFVPFTRLQTATSRDGKSLATLSRRFSGEGAIRSVLQIWDIARGELVTRHEIVSDLAPALAWHPDGSLVFVATASPVAEDASTQIRAYRTGLAQ
ncbi:hypothetical protein [Shinella sedimenti]|uniref:WD40 repeat domain-containing protein n=1 Tax=Shinella sedimenti TaxID=2919913 RepID=A0ABT0CT27_9HYPH|nr:hypothetical protein [Shinella sedimenti]MCJ8151762.1 hypothetical protein [Shinella sedimenti]